MVDRINFNNIQYINKPAFKSAGTQLYTTNPQSFESSSLEGLNTLSIYNQPIVNKAPNLDIPILKRENIPNNINQIEGEKVYDSNGTLIEIRSEDKNFIKIFKPNNKNYVYNIIEKASGKIIKSQVKSSCDRFGDIIDVTEFQGSTQFRTCYQLSTNKPKILDKITTGDNGNISAICYDYDTNKFTSVEENQKQRVFRLYNKNKQLIDYKIDRTRSYDDETVKITPLPKFIPSGKEKELEGEKSYYSNGQVECITTKNEQGEKVVYKFSPSGELEEIVEGNMKININDENQQIEKLFSNNNKKYTTYYNDGSMYIEEISANNKFEGVHLNKYGKIIEKTAGKYTTNNQKIFE